MKNMLIFTLLFITISQTASAQQPQIDLDNNSNACTGDLTVILHVYSVSAPCTQVGVTNPFSFPTGGATSYTYSTVPNGWSTDLGTPNCGGGTQWYFGKAEVYNCVGLASSGSTNCTSGNYDGVVLQETSGCGGNPTQCFEYSTGCTNCSSGTVIDFTFSDGGKQCAGISTLNIN